MLMAKEEEKQANEEHRDEELDVAKAVEKAQNIMRKVVGNLQQKEFRLENVDQNGANTRYVVICSIVPDIGKERDYYFIKIDVEKGILVPPMGRGKKDVKGDFVFQKIDIKPEWME